MYKISDLISTPVISLFECEYLGIINNIYFDSKQKKCTYVCILNESENIKKIIKIQDIYKIGKECVFVKNKSNINLKTDCDKELFNSFSLINLLVFNLEGLKLGISHDIIIDKNFNLDKIILNNSQELNSKEIFNISKSMILISKSKISTLKFKPKSNVIKQNIPNNKVIILNKDKQEEKEPITNNEKIITDYRFLIGRKLLKDIQSFNGEVIAKKSTAISKDIIKKASLIGKLVEVARYSK